MTTTAIRRAAVGASAAALILTPTVAAAQEPGQDPAPPSIAQLCAATDVAAVDALLATASESDLASSLAPIASLVVPDDPDGLTLNAGVQLAEVRSALACDDDTTDPAPTTGPDDGGGEVFYENCAAAIAAGAAPIVRANDEPGYRPELDADGDGIACEANEDVPPPDTSQTPFPTNGPDTDGDTGGDTDGGGGFSQLDDVPSAAADTGGGPA